jgi:hypothetical protein
VQVDFDRAADVAESHGFEDVGREEDVAGVAAFEFGERVSRSRESLGMPLTD